LATLANDVDGVAASQASGVALLVVLKDVWFPYSETDSGFVAREEALNNCSSRDSLKPCLNLQEDPFPHRPRIQNRQVWFSTSCEY
jgi:hypothetical protein